MSTAHDAPFRCPYCGREMTIRVYDSVNAQADPDLRESCISGDIFRHSCSKCGRDFMVQNNLVYTDSEHKFILWLSSEEVNGQLSRLAETLVSQGYRMRRCGTLREFTEKIQIFEDGINDIAVELAKYDSFIEYIDNRQGNPEDVTSVEYQSTNDGVMKINVRCDDKGLSFLIPYAMLEEEINAESDLFAVDDTVFPQINSDWIISLFKEAQGIA